MNSAVSTALSLIRGTDSRRRAVPDSHMQVGAKTHGLGTRRVLHTPVAGLDYPQQTRNPKYVNSIGTSNGHGEYGTETAATNLQCERTGQDLTSECEGATSLPNPMAWGPGA